jgi:hypothetical protein
MGKENKTLRNEKKLWKEFFMNKIKTAIVLSLFVVFVSGVTAQTKPTAQQAEQIIREYEKLATAYEDFAKETGDLAAQKNATKQQLIKGQNHWMDLKKQESHSQINFNDYYARGGEDFINGKLGDRFRAASDRISRAGARIEANLDTINSRF